MTPEEIKALQDSLAAEKAKAEDLAKKLAEATKPPPEKKDPPEDQTLNDKVRKENEEKARREGDTKKLETAFLFNHSSAKFIEENKSILPKEIGEIFVAAEKEKYDSAIDKANATKAAIIQQFFSLQANLDLTTPYHKSQINEYLKLTKKGREEKADEIYSNVFEPALQLIKQVKKAEEVALSKTGMSFGTDSDKAYKEKLMAGSRKHYLGEKGT
jgi:hypothetical protein